MVLDRGLEQNSEFLIMRKLLTRAISDTISSERTSAEQNEHSNSIYIIILMMHLYSALCAKAVKAIRLKFCTTEFRILKRRAAL